ncbi:WD40 repeat domain-containing protein [Myxococcus sp. 1LA]
MPGDFADHARLVQCSDDELEALLDLADFGHFVASRDLPPLRARLRRLEYEQGLTEVHRRVSEKVLAAGTRLVESPRYTGRPHCFALSPSGRHLAIASNSISLSSDLAVEILGGDLRVWELATGRVVNVVGGKELSGWGGVRGQPDALQWSPSGEWLGCIANQVVVGVARAFDSTQPSFTVDVTRRWGSPPPWSAKRPETVANLGHTPAWCWSPDGTQLFVSTPGPDKALGCVVPFRDGAAFNEDSEEVRWCPARLDGESPKASPHTWVRWSADGTRVYGYCDAELDAEKAQDEPAPSASSLDVQTGDFRYRIKDVTLPVAFSPDGALLAYGAKRLELVDGHTGRKLATLSEEMDEGDEATELVWSRDGRRLAVITYYDVYLFEEGGLLCRLRVDTLASSSVYRNAPCRWAWSPDGAMGACLLQEGGFESWEVGRTPRLLRRLKGVGYLDGLIWGADDTLVGMGTHRLVFWDVKRGHLRAHYSFDEEPGRVLPLDDWNPWPEGPAPFIPTERGWAFTRVLPDGTVVCPPEARERLAPRLSFAVAGQYAWPWHWAVGTRHTRLEDWPPAPVATAPEEGAPFEEHELPAPEGRTAKAKAAHRAKWGPLTRYQVAARPLRHYRAHPVFTRGDAICRENLAPYVGRAVLLSLSENWFRPVTASLLDVTQEGALLRLPSMGVWEEQENRVVDYRWITWIGPAEPLERP